MATLRTSLASPFGRKVRMAIHVLGMSEKIRVEPADTSDPSDALRQQNPLGKVPALVLDDGEVLFDSRVIVDYLDALNGQAQLVPASGWARFEVLRQQALADGLLDAALLQMYEKRFRPETHRVQSWVSYQQEKVERALAALAHRPPVPHPAGPHIGELALASALGYLDFRFDGTWRDGNPALAAWLQRFAQRVPAFEATDPRS